MDRILTSLVAFLDGKTRLLIIKDFRMFRRDPAQWAQVLIFTGLMVLYFTNMRRFYQEELGRAYQNGVSLMNLAATALLLCAYTGRFIFPMLSLEGRLFDMGEWPTLVLGGGIVHGELFEVLDVAVFAKLDPFEECDPADPGRSRYTRERVALVEPETEAWVYVANEPVPHDALIESGSWYAWRTRR